MARGLKKHLKRLNAPKHWMLDKLGGAFVKIFIFFIKSTIFALFDWGLMELWFQMYVFRPPSHHLGPHKAKKCLPLALILRNRLKYALTYHEVVLILMQRHVLVDGKVRTDKTYPSGFMDVVSIPKTNENFRMLFDTKGRFRLRSIRDEEAKFKLCKVRSVQFGKKGIPYLKTFDGRTIQTYKITDFIKFDVGNVIMVTGGRNRGRVGFATRLGNVFTIGKGTKPWVSLPKDKGIKLSIIEEAKK
ncbi:unnamed protein product [Malus baccata var. baccata]